MTLTSLEGRLDTLEKQFLDLRAQVQKLVRPKNWRNIVGIFDGDEVMMRIFENARKIREEDRRQTRPKATERKQRKRS